MSYNLTIKTVDGSVYRRTGRTEAEQMKVTQEWRQLLIDEAHDNDPNGYFEVKHSNGVWIFRLDAITFMTVEEAQS